MNRRDFIKLAVAGFGTMLASGAAINMLNTKSVPETAPIAEAAPQAADGKQSVLLAAAGSNLDWTMECLNKYYATLSSYMRWQNRGTVFAPNCKTRAEILKTNYPQAAYDLGYKL